MVLKPSKLVSFWALKSSTVEIFWAVKFYHPKSLKKGKFQGPNNLKIREFQVPSSTSNKESILVSYFYFSYFPFCNHTSNFPLKRGTQLFFLLHNTSNLFNVPAESLKIFHFVLLSKVTVHLLSFKILYWLFISKHSIFRHGPFLVGYLSEALQIYFNQNLGFVFLIT